VEEKHPPDQGGFYTRSEGWKAGSGAINVG